MLARVERTACRWEKMRCWMSTCFIGHGLESNPGEIWIGAPLASVGVRLGLELEFDSMKGTALTCGSRLSASQGEGEQRLNRLGHWADDWAGLLWGKGRAKESCRPACWASAALQPEQKGRAGQNGGREKKPFSFF